MENGIVTVSHSEKVFEVYTAAGSEIKVGDVLTFNTLGEVIPIEQTAYTEPVIGIAKTASVGGTDTKRGTCEIITNIDFLETYKNHKRKIIKKAEKERDEIRQKLWENFNKKRINAPWNL